MSSPNGNDPAAVLRSEEATLTKILHAKMIKQDCFSQADQEAVAYRISEIMVAAKELYTKELPGLISEDDEAADNEIFADLAGLRMTLFHLRDLITDFDEAFLDAMTHLRDGDEPDESSDEDDEEDEEDDEEEDDAAEAEA